MHPSISRGYASRSQVNIICLLLNLHTSVLTLLSFNKIQFKPDPRFEEAIEYIKVGTFGSYNYSDLLSSLEGDSGYGRGDYFLVGYDFPGYLDAQSRVDEAYK